MAKKKNNLSGSPRLQAFDLLNDLLSLPKNKKKLKEAMQEAFDEDPVLFYKQFVHPVATKELVIVPGGGKTPATLKILFGDDNEPS